MLKKAKQSQISAFLHRSAILLLICKVHKKLSLVVIVIKHFVIKKAFLFRKQFFCEKQNRDIFGN